MLRPQPWAGETQLLQSCCCLLEAPPHALPKGRGFIPAVFEVVVVVLLPFGEGWDEACCLRGGNYVSSPLFFAFVRGEEINTKSRGGGCRLRLGVDGGADSRKTSFPPAVSTIPTVMHGMTTAAATVIKAALGRKKKSAVGGKKTAAY